MCVLIFLQLRREFRAIAEIDVRAASLMSSWPDWWRDVQFSKAEAATCPIIRKLLLEYEAGAGMDNPTDFWLCMSVSAAVLATISMMICSNGE